MTKQIMFHVAFIAAVLIVGFILYGVITDCPGVSSHYRKCSEVTGADVFWFAVVAGVSYYWLMRGQK